MRRLEPIRGRIIVKRIKRNVTKGGLMLPDKREQTTVEGEVIAIGPGLRAMMSGEFIEPQIKVGDIVLYWENDPGLIQFDFEGDPYEALSDEQSILCKIKETE